MNAAQSYAVHAYEHFGNYAEFIVEPDQQAPEVSTQDAISEALKQGRFGAAEHDTSPQTQTQWLNTIVLSLLLHLAVVAGVYFYRFAPHAAPLAANVMPVQLVDMPSTTPTTPPVVAPTIPAPTLLKQVAPVDNTTPAAVQKHPVVPAKKHTAMRKTPREQAAQPPFNRASSTHPASTQPETPPTIEPAATPPQQVAQGLGVTPLSTPSSAQVMELAMQCHVRPAPVYPPAARRFRETGLVVVEVVLNPQGRVAQATVVQSSGSTRLDNAALAAVQQWQCDTTTAAKPNRVAQQPFHFELKPAS